eukprot:Polyplicarium_translucidae@DN3387_c0_g1_i16.p2
MQFSSGSRWRALISLVMRLAELVSVSCGMRRKGSKGDGPSIPSRGKDAPDGRRCSPQHRSSSILPSRQTRIELAGHAHQFLLAAELHIVAPRFGHLSVVVSAFGTLWSL